MSNRESTNAAPSASTPIRAGIVIALCVALTACGIHWPWRHRKPNPPPPVQELAIAPAEGSAPAAILQFWDRNTLQLDLTGVSGEGGAALRLLPGHTWPIRLEFKVQPGRFALLEVTGAQRVVFEVPAQGAPVVFRLAPGAYVRATAQITVRWSAAEGSAH
jgi:hypothetical protein